MFTICRALISEGTLVETLQGMRELEGKFNRDAGVLDRRFYQSLQQPHLIWCNTEWTTEGAHNVAAHGLMKVRHDDRVASAFFLPGMYFEIFVDEVPAGRAEWSTQEGSLIVVCHGLVADKAREEWWHGLPERISRATERPGLQRVRTFRNHYAGSEFVGVMEWQNQECFTNAHRGDSRTIEEEIFVGAKPYQLAAYDQFQCSPLAMK